METIGDDAKRVILAGAARARHKRAPAECIWVELTESRLLCLRHSGVCLMSDQTILSRASIF